MKEELSQSGAPHAPRLLIQAAMVKDEAQSTKKKCHRGISSGIIKGEKIGG